MGSQPLGVEMLLVSIILVAERVLSFIPIPAGRVVKVISCGNGGPMGLGESPLVPRSVQIIISTLDKSQLYTWLI